MRYSKTLERLVARDKRLDSYDFCPLEGHYIYANNGWIFPDMECMGCHEYTVKDCLRVIRTIKAVSDNEQVYVS